MNRDFFERLYQGYAAEHYVSSDLFRRGYEVFRLPADFGLDLVVTNQFMASGAQQESDEHFPYAIQVKSRWLNGSSVFDSSTGRYRSRAVFYLSHDELELLLKTKNSGLALVTYIQADQGSAFIPRMLFMTSKHIRQLLDEGFILADREKKEIHIEFRLHPVQKRSDFINELMQKGSLNDDQIKHLNTELPDEFKRNWNAKDYVAVGRKYRITTEPGLAWKQIPLATDFSGFPYTEDINIPA